MLDSNTGGVFLDIAQSQFFLEEYGSLFKSNSNGTFYSRVLSNSNRNERGLGILISSSPFMFYDQLIIVLKWILKK